MIKAVIFDYFGVICSDEYWRWVKADKNIKGGEFQNLSREVNLGKLSWHDFVKEVAKKLGKSPEEITKLYQSEHIHPEVLAYAAKLHEKYKTALLTNASYEFLQPVVERAKLDDVFDEIIMSSVVGVTKPNPEIFEEALSRLGVGPQEAVFIDEIDYNVHGAKAVGLNTILYNNFEQMKFELEEIVKN